MSHDLCTICIWVAAALENKIRKIKENYKENIPGNWFLLELVMISHNWFSPVLVWLHRILQATVKDQSGSSYNQKR